MSPTERNLGLPASSIGRVAAILGCFSPQEPTLTLTELSLRTGLPKSTMSRLVSELVEHAFLEREGREVSLGLKAFELGEIAARPNSLRRVVYPAQERLRRSTGQTVHLAVLEGRHVVYLHILRARNTPPLPSRVGGRVPAHATAVGKAMLAFTEPDVVDRLIEGGLPKVGPRTITNGDALRAALWRARSVGRASEEEESAPGVACVAAPILDEHGRPVAGLSVSGRIGEIDLTACGDAVQRATARLWRGRGPLAD